MKQKISEALLQLGCAELRTWAVHSEYRTFSCKHSQDLYFVDEQGLWVGPERATAKKISDNVVHAILLMAQ